MGVLLERYEGPADCTTVEQWNELLSGIAGEAAKGCLCYSLTVRATVQRLCPLALRSTLMVPPGSFGSEIS